DRLVDSARARLRAIRIDHENARHHLVIDPGVARIKLRSTPVNRGARPLPDTTPPVRWQPDRSPNAPPWPVPPLLTAIGRGLMGRCPACGQTHVFNGWLSVTPECLVCGAPLGRFRADDAPPYFVIFAVGHIVVPLL